MSALFTPLTLAGTTLANRAWVSPMCMYACEDGSGEVTAWHAAHYAQFALGGAGLVLTEATAVTPEGRVTPQDAGLWSDAHVTPWRQVTDAVHACGGRIGVQLAHAGRKASTDLPWKGGKQIAPDHGDGWQTVAPSSLPFAGGEVTPQALTTDALKDLCTAFADAARRAARLGIDAVQLHGAHGYLLHQFLSPLSNRRDDAYGGSLANRMRFPLEVFDAVRAAFPADRPVTGSDWVEGGWDVEQTVAFAQALEARGCTAIHVSSGGLDPRQAIPVGPSYQVPLARAVKQGCGLPVVAVGLITDYEQAEAIVGTGDADMIALARTILYDPRWPWHAAAHLGAQVKAPDQYLRSQPRRFRDLFDPEDG